ncbi:hypothetical protein BS47DRAFT_1395889 [Hydnum rufescens UP504]|uniref:Uncharacterized protein n=1 Tax=Hydnum rufescens UP504 TaxID=1448309 RepID=A0A9P6DR02_9AGAM|nr:hypothetical protein BS47DRAFT_1395889 [Hydnum rufescens UP504]
MDSGFRPNHWIDHKEKLFSKGISTFCTALSFGFNSHSRKHIQLSALVLEVSSDSVEHVKTSFVGVHPYSTVLKGKPDIPIVVSECMPNSEKQLQLWGFERLKDNQIKRFFDDDEEGQLYQRHGGIALRGVVKGRSSWQANPGGLPQVDLGGRQERKPPGVAPIGGWSELEAGKANFRGPGKREFYC